MLVTTTTQAEGIKSYLGMVVGEAVMGTHFFKDFLASFRDFMGGRVKTYEKELAEGRRIAMEEMIAEAEQLGADAIIGVDIDYEHIGGGEKTLLLVSMTGTAVKVKH